MFDDYHERNPGRLNPPLLGQIGGTVSTPDLIGIDGRPHAGCQLDHLAGAKKKKKKREKAGENRNTSLTNSQNPSGKIHYYGPSHSE